MPKITVCIPTFNRVGILPYAIDSVLNQSEQDFELIVCDDGSSDRTSETIGLNTSVIIKILVKVIICALVLMLPVVNIL
jgi:GT2 family glycosyltransferase